MPNAIPSGSFVDHHVSLETLKCDLQLFVNRRKLPDLDLSIARDFPLFSVLNFCYHCWLSIKGVDLEAQRLFVANRGKVLKALLKASSQPKKPQPVMIKSTDGLVDEFDITFDATNSTVTFGERFYRRHDKSGPVTFEYATTDVWALSSLAVFKKNCLSAYIESAHESGAVADLSDIDLRKLDTRDFQFDRTKITARDFRHFASQGRTVSLIGAEVLGNLRGVSMMNVDFKIDKRLALQLIEAGADKGAVLEAYLNTERALNKPTKIDLGGFDLSGVDLVGFDFRDVNF